MSWIGTLAAGFVVGLIARAVTPGRGPKGLILTTILGIAGAALASFVGEKLGIYSVDDKVGWIAATLGAAALLGIYHFASAPDAAKNDTPRIDA